MSADLETVRKILVVLRQVHSQVQRAHAATKASTNVEVQVGIINALAKLQELNTLILALVPDEPQPIARDMPSDAAQSGPEWPSGLESEIDVE